MAKPSRARVSKTRYLFTKYDLSSALRIVCHRVPLNLE